MMRSLYTAASGMMAQQMNIDNISNNLANVQSTAFKKSRLDFQDLLYSHSQAPGAEATAGTQIGMGVRSVSSQKLFSTGSLRQTGNNFDVAIQGDGFFSVKMPDGRVCYTRDGSFKLDGEGNLVTNAGYSIGIKIPKDITNVEISQDGKVTGIPINGTEPVEIGQIKLTRFLNPAGLKAMGGNLYEWTPVAGQKVEDNPNTPGMGTLVQGYLEKSNVNVVEEMINIIQAQRAYEINQKSIQAADEMMRQANQLHKG
ncbi:MAG: flagellar basal-body rod protein FlgG [Candidatus Eremiobacteraeota bacterium]|nr:flagellar basal-body rod protein FlgG [Candidatus Eremiobacteraeota bacterium]